ncbi:MAG TPA: hypothetical protein VFI04_04240 [Gaiellaceae bacterium]|nr:hypothetical protein [Gaiellaceae bacterium]
MRVMVLAAAAVAIVCGGGRTQAAVVQTRHLEYVVTDGSVSVFDIDHAHRLVQTIPLPEARGVRGVGASLRYQRLYVSFGGDGGGGSGSTGSLAAVDLRSGRVVWTRSYGTGIDSFAVTPDGRTIYLPTGELSTGTDWLVIAADTGALRGKVSGGRGPHNTVVGLDGRLVWLGGRTDSYLVAVSTSSGRVVRRVGPLLEGVRPFTINGRQTLAYTTATGLLGFQLSDARTGRVLYTVRVPGYRYDPSTYRPSAPSHGISLAPDERRLYVIDGPNSAVHVFDVSRGGARRPRLVASIRLRHPLTGNESPCAYDCARDGWLQTSRDGRYLYVGDSGDVIDTRTRRVVAFLAPLRETRKMLEIDWRGTRVVGTTTRTGLGYVR